MKQLKYQKNTLNVLEAALLAQMSPESVRRAIQIEQLPSWYDKIRNCTVMSRSAIMDWRKSVMAKKSHGKGK